MREVERGEGESSEGVRRMGEEREWGGWEKGDVEEEGRREEREKSEFTKRNVSDGSAFDANIK
jgi:hypothetical protein